MFDLFHFDMTSTVGYLSLFVRFPDYLIHISLNKENFNSKYFLSILISNLFYILIPTLIKGSSWVWCNYMRCWKIHLCQ